MIRLYPQVIRSEESIQDLRRVLGEIDLENRDQAGQLSDASLRIQQIGSELAQAEQERGWRRQSSRSAAQASKGLRERLQAQKTADDDLRQTLGRSEAGHARQLERLAESELASKAKWDVILDRRAQMEELRAQLQDQADQQEALENALGIAVQRRLRLSGEYRDAEASAALHRCELREAGTQSQENAANASGKEAEGTEALKQLDYLEAERQRLKGRLSLLTHAQPESVKLRQKLYNEMKQFQLGETAFDDQQRDAERLRDCLADSEETVCSLRKTLAVEETNVVTLREGFHLYTQENSELASALHEARQDGAELQANMRSVENTAQQLEKELQGQLATLSREAADLERGTATLDDSLQNTHLELKREEAEKNRLVMALAQCEAEREELTAKNVEAEEEYRVEKEKCRCVIS